MWSDDNKFWNFCLKIELWNISALLMGINFCVYGVATTIEIKPLLK